MYFMQMCGFTVVACFVAVPLIARVTVQFVNASFLEVVTLLSTNGGKDIQHYHVGLGDVVGYCIIRIIAGAYSMVCWFVM